MEHIQFSSFSEKDFDEIICDAGGKRYTDSLNIKELNCDYILDDAVIELKIIEEEPIEKKIKQKKFIDLFPTNIETVILSPSKEQENKYFKILESPIQTALKKASKQLQKSAKKINAKLKIAIIMNNGLYMVSQDEFKEMSIRRVKNDTSGIDILIICSMYYYSDGFDMVTLFDFDDNDINEITYQHKRIIIDKLKNAWDNKIEEYMTKQLLNQDIDRNKQPIQDLFFEHNDIRYIKPNLQWGEPSEFWINGRPRKDTTKENDLPLIRVRPIFDEKVYYYVKKHMLDNSILHSSLNDYLEWVQNNVIQKKNKIQTMTYIKLDFNDFQDTTKPFNESDIQHLANMRYEMLYQKIKNEMTEYQENLECDNFIFIKTYEIGMDKANDIAYISHIYNNSRVSLVYGKRIKYEYAIDLAISLCISVKAEKVYFVRNEDCKWK